jgi:hypothetical protein
MSTPIFCNVDDRASSVSLPPTKRENFSALTHRSEGFSVALSCSLDAASLSRVSLLPNVVTDRASDSQARGESEMEVSDDMILVRSGC